MVPDSALYDRVSEDLDTVLFTKNVVFARPGFSNSYKE